MLSDVALLPEIPASVSTFLLFDLTNISEAINILQQQNLNGLETKVQERYNLSDLLHCSYHRQRISKQSVAMKSTEMLSDALRSTKKVSWWLPSTEEALALLTLHPHCLV